MKIRWELDLNQANTIISMLAGASGPNVTWQTMNELIVPLQKQTEAQVKAAAAPSNVVNLPVGEPPA